MIKRENTEANYWHKVLPVPPTPAGLLSSWKSWESYWGLFIRHCQCQQLMQKSLLFQAVTVQQERHLPRHVCIAAPLLRLVICIAPAKASYRQRAEGSFAKGCGTQGFHGFLQEIDIRFPLWFDIGLLLTYHDVC